MSAVASEEVDLKGELCAEAPWRALRGIFLDLDGVVFRGRRMLPGAAELGQLVADLGLSLTVVSNNSADSPAVLAARLSRAGLPVTANHVVTAALATRLYMERRYPKGIRVLILGAVGLRRLILGDGRFLADALEPDVVIVGRPQRWSLDEVRRACQAVWAGADFIGTNPDTYIPGEGGILPETGAMLAYIVAATGRKPLIIGKPRRAIFEIALARTGLAPAEILMIGDQPEIDVAAANRLGMRSALVLSGEPRTPRRLRSVTRPDLIFDSLAELVRAWRAAAIPS